MIQQIKIKLQPDGKRNFSFQLGSVMQGVIMKLIDDDYAARLHKAELHPYSQYIISHGGTLEWTVSALDDDAGQIIDRLKSDDFKEAFLENRGERLSVISREAALTTYDELFEQHYISGKAYRFVTLEFVTPTSFKSSGSYLLFPSVFHIFQSLIKKYDSASDTTEIYDESLMNAIDEQIQITDYRLQSTRFYLEKTRIPSFIGRITLKINGASEFIRLMNMLLHFAEFSGVGIKTAIGMGACKIVNLRGDIAKK